MSMQELVGFRGGLSRKMLVFDRMFAYVRKRYIKRCLNLWQAGY